MGKGARKITELTVKQLFGLSGNRCANPKCQTKLITSEAMLAEICHIEAASANGPRYNKKMSDDERADIENLILLCRNCHKTTDNEEIYDVEVLKKMKDDHESKYRDFEPDDSDVEKLYKSVAYNISFTEKEEWGILEEIIKFTLENSATVNPTFEQLKKDGKLVFTEEKVQLNIPSDQIYRFKEMYLRTAAKRMAIQKYLKDLNSINPVSVEDLRESVIIKYCELKEYDVPEIKIGRIKTLVDLAKMLIPESKVNSPGYLAVAESLVIQYFEMCDIGEKTKPEIQPIQFSFNFS